LVRLAPSAEFAFRTLEVFSDHECRRWRGVNPFLIDVDRDGGDPQVLDDLFQRTVTYVREQSWEHRAYASGEGYHIEVSPESIVGEVFMNIPDYEEAQNEVRRSLGATGGFGGGTPVIDIPGDPLKLLRFPGSLNRKGGKKVPIEETGPGPA
jgi:hypothetical protein